MFVYFTLCNPAVLSAVLSFTFVTMRVLQTAVVFVRALTLTSEAILHMLGAFKYGLND